MVNSYFENKAIQKIDLLTLADSSIFKQTKDPVYDQSLKRLFNYRLKLDSELEKSNFDLNHYEKFCTDLEVKLQEVNVFLKDYKFEASHEGRLQTITNIHKNDQLVAKFLIRKRAKLIIKLMYKAHKSVHSIKSISNSIHKDYKKINLNFLIENIQLLREEFKNIVQIFNTLLKIKIVKDSELYQYFYMFICTKNASLMQLFEEIFTWSFGLISWPSITLETISDPPDNHRELFLQILRFLLELETCKLNLEGSIDTVENFFLFSLNENDWKFRNTVIKLMAEPFIKRFHFYFLNKNSKLNNIENVRIIYLFI